MVDPRGGGLTSVSCLVGGNCVATDFDGQTIIPAVTAGLGRPVSQQDA